MQLGRMRLLRRIWHMPASTPYSAYKASIDVRTPRDVCAMRQT